MKRVSFSHFIIHVYNDDEETKKGIWESIALDRVRFKDKIKKFELKYTKMNSVQQLLEKYITPNKSTIVFGNLGRRPSLLIYYFNMLFKDLDVTIRSRWITDLETCTDVLVWLEPEFGQIIEKPSHANCMIVFTSHLHLNYSDDVVGYHLGDPCTRYEPLMKKKRFDLQHWPSLKKCIVLKPEPFQFVYREIPKDSHVIVNLTHCRDSHETYVCLMNSFDVLNYYESHVIVWFILFNPTIKFDNDMHMCNEKLKNAKFLTATTTCIEKLRRSHFLLENYN